MKALDTIISGGTLFTDDGRLKADLGIREGKIVAIEKILPAGLSTEKTQVVHARNKYVIPGGIDVHVHLDLPVGDGIVTCDDWISGTRSAARGGVTTVIDFATPRHGESLQSTFDHWMEKAREKAFVDYCFHMSITDWNLHGPEMKQLVDMGCPTFKEYTIYADRGLQSSDRDIFRTLEACKELDAMLLLHAESPSVLDELIGRYHQPAMIREYGVQLHSMSRPNYIEAEAIQRAIVWAEHTGGTLYIVHVSTAEGAELIRGAQQRGVRVLGETCPHYLVLDESVFRKKEAYLLTCCPQIKSKKDQQRLWQGLRRGEISVVSTDTCSFTRAQKQSGEGDWTRIPMGLPGVETLIPIVYTHGVLTGKLRMRQLVEKCCTNPARIMGLYPRKGTLRVGSDADIVIIDPGHEVIVDPQHMESCTDWSPYQDWRLFGFAEKTFCRGRLIVDNYRCVGEAGWGQWLRRERAGTF